MFFLTLLSGSLLAQTDAKQQVEMKHFAENFHAGATAIGAITFDRTVTGSPYSATVVNESVQTLADGNRIVQKTSGTTARDSEGRTRNDAQSPDDRQHVRRWNSAPGVHRRSRDADILYAQPRRKDRARHGQQDVDPDDHAPPGAAAAGVKVISRDVAAMSSEHMGPMTLELSGAKIELDKEQTEARTEDLGTQVIEGVNAQGVRTTRSDRCR